MDHCTRSRRIVGPAWAALCAPLLLLGCAHDKGNAEARVAAPLIEPEVEPRAVAVIPPPPPTAAVFVVSESVRLKCNLPQTPEGSPQFDFEEATLRDRGKDILDRIATCMTQGSLQDQGITVIGHADPRGPKEYNMDLGLERAKAARDYLSKNGVASSSVQIETRGEKQADGTGPQSWQLDRRVEIEETATR